MLRDKNDKMLDEAQQRACIHSLNHFCIDHDDDQEPTHYCSWNQIIYKVIKIDEYIDDVILHLIRLSNGAPVYLVVRQCQCPNPSRGG